jgi:hypothetical protein
MGRLVMVIGALASTVVVAQSPLIGDWSFSNASYGWSAAFTFRPDGTYRYHVRGAGWNLTHQGIYSLQQVMPRFAGALAVSGTTMVTLTPRQIEGNATPLNLQSIGALKLPTDSESERFTFTRRSDGRLDVWNERFPGMVELKFRPESPTPSSSPRSPTPTPPAPSTGELPAFCKGLDREGCLKMIEEVQAQIKRIA